MSWLTDGAKAFRDGWCCMHPFPEQDSERARMWVEGWTGAAKADEETRERLAGSTPQANSADK